MPKIRHHRIPQALLEHLLDRMLAREISEEQLGLFAAWLDTIPEVPRGPWFKRFPGLIVRRGRMGEDDFARAAIARRTGSILSRDEFDSLTGRL